MRKFINGLPCYSISPVDSGMFEIALVDSPAIEEEFLKFSNDKYEFNSEKQNIKGSVMIPDLPIYRNNPPRYVIFNAETIKKCQDLFLKNGSKFNIDHSDKKIELEIIESKINEVDDRYGKKGAWVLEAHIKDNKLWKEIKGGKFNGFSIESIFMQFNNQEMSVLEQIKALVNDVAFAEVPKVEDPKVEVPKVEDSKIDELVKKLEERIGALEARVEVLEGSDKAIKEEMSKVSVDLAKFGAQEISTPVVDEVTVPVATNRFSEFF